MRPVCSPLPLLVGLLACNPVYTEAPETSPPAPQPTLTATQTGSAAGAPAPTAPAPAATPAATPAPATRPAPAPETLEERQVSKSAGVAGGVTVLWPRIIPREIVDENRDLAAALQQQMRRIVEKHLPGRPLDFRPEPERVCPQGGCAGASVGLLLSRSGNGCLVLALVSRPGASPTKIVPWVGKVQLRTDTIGFREWPESQIVVSDFVPCNALLTTMDAGEASVAAALKAAAQ